MTCGEFLARHSEYLDERMDPFEAARWERHVEECSSCARYDRVLRRGRTVARNLPAVEPAPDFWPRLQHRILMEPGQPDAGPSSSAAGVVMSLAVAAVLAAVAWSPLVRQEPLRVNLTGGTGPGPVRQEAVAQRSEPAYDGLASRDAGVLVPDPFVPVGPYTPGTWRPVGAFSAWGGGAARAAGVQRLPAGPHSPVEVAPPAFRPADWRVPVRLSAGGRMAE